MYVYSCYKYAVTILFWVTLLFSVWQSTVHSSVMESISFLVSVQGSLFISSLLSKDDHKLSLINSVTDHILHHGKEHKANRIKL
ncbi:hypothetical protein VNO77_45161 [Canavalia gladiata]|uniref:Uncharacterized protein n=1 Tax=Canavalia gladiata TaxID=3824 RepID=A0AAN9PNT4_CANGL